MAHAELICEVSLRQEARLLQRIQHEVSAHGCADPPADDPAGKDVDDEGDIDKTLPGGDVGEVGDPELVWAICLEGTMHPFGYSITGVGHA